MLNSVFVHSDLTAFPDSACSTLGSVSFVHHTGTFLIRSSIFAHVLTIPIDGTLKEPSAGTTSEDSVVFSICVILTDFAGNILWNSTGEFSYEVLDFLLGGFWIVSGIVIWFLWVACFEVIVAFSIDDWWLVVVGDVIWVVSP